MQRVYSYFDGEMDCLAVPDANAYVMDGLRWGGVDEWFTPAFWKAHAWQHERHGTFDDLRLGSSLCEETAACLLGGFGMPAEMGLAAYARLRERDLLSGAGDEAAIYAALAEPFAIAGRVRHYRFARQRAAYLAATLAYLEELAEPDDDIDLRGALTGAPGIGLKTASWVVRNYRRSNRVAVLDVHVVRACAMMGLFESQTVTPGRYERMEAAYIGFANAIGVRASLLDALIWDYMRRLYAVDEPPSAQLSLF